MTKTTEQPKTLHEQYVKFKEKYPEALLLFRCGDFYETYGEDAEKASKILGITLTRRKSDETKMAGFPYHALDSYLPKLIRNGCRVAICDQIEQPKKTVKRGTTVISTPDDTNTNQSKENAMETKETTPIKVTKNMVTTVPIEEHNAELDKVRKACKQKVLDIARMVVKTLNGTLPSTLNSQFADAIGRLNLINIKVNNGFGKMLTTEEINYLTSMTRKAEEAGL